MKIRFLQPSFRVRTPGGTGTSRQTTARLTPASRQRILLVSGVMLLPVLLAASGLGPSLVAGREVDRRLLAEFVALMITAGGMYAAAVLISRKAADSAALRWSIVALGVGLRLTMVTGPPILEDDHYRYQWDGALVAHGHNPYRYSPRDIRLGAVPHKGAPLEELAAQSGDILERINYPWLRSIYPPVAQSAFGLAHILSPWSLSAWRLVLALFDLMALGMLNRMGVTLTGLVVYWWNPLLIKEVYNSGHVDALLLPVLLVVVSTVRKNRPLLATAAVGAATGIKLWPALLLPTLLYRVKERPRVMIASVSLFALCLAAALLPMVLAGWNSSSGLAAYSRYWEMNDAVYTVIAWVAGWTAGLLSLPPVWEQLIPRLAAAGCVVGIAAWAAARREWDPGRQFLVIATGLFMISPTQFPWYYLWMLPFLALHPYPALVVYTALLPLYYLRPLMVRMSQTDLFDYGIVWVEHGPIIIWLGLAWLRSRRQNRSRASG